MHRGFFIALMLALGVCGAFAPADAQERIGRAAVIRNDVSQIAPRVIKISTGDEIFRDETVRTAADSDAKFVLRDDTNLSLGPGSTLKLDRAVFSGETSAGDIAVKLTSGAFRFVTGHSTKESYKIVTPLATIGVRGTTLDFLIQRGRNVVVLQDGQARVCAGGQCVDLLNPGRLRGHHLDRRKDSDYQGSARRPGHLRPPAPPIPRCAARPRTPKPPSPARPRSTSTLLPRCAASELER